MTDLDTEAGLVPLCLKLHCKTQQKLLLMYFLSVMRSNCGGFTLVMFHSLSNIQFPALIDISAELLLYII